MSQVSVMINGRTYRMACDDGQEDHLLGLAEQLNRTIDELRRSFGEIGDQRLTVMAAITMSDGLSEARRRIRELEAEIARLQQAEKAADERFEAHEAQVARAIVNAAQRITGAASRLNGGAGTAD